MVKGFLNLGQRFLTMVENFLNKEVKNHRKDDIIKQGNRKQMSHGSCKKGGCL